MKFAKFWKLCLALALVCAVASAETLRLPASLTYIGEEAFARDRSLDAVVVPEGTEEIGPRAFAGSSMRSLSLPGSVTRIADDALEGCEGVEITAPAGSYAAQWASEHGVGQPPTPDSAFVFRERDDGTYEIIDYTGDYDEVIIPASYQGRPVTAIATSFYDLAFYRAGMTAVTIPNSVTSIGSGAFAYCARLKAVTIPESVTQIGWWAFGWCESLERVTLSSQVSEYHTTFINCDSLRDVTVPNGVKVLTDTFGYCDNLVYVTLPKTVTELCFTFTGCTGLRHVTVPNSVRRIEDGVFQYCDNLESVTISNSVTQIDGEVTFMGCDKLTINGVAGSNVEAYAKSNGIPFRPVTAEPFILNAETAQSMYFLGVGQTMQPTFTFSDGKAHSFTPLGCRVLSGSCVSPYLLGIQADTLGEGTVECVLALNDTDCILNPDYMPRFKVQVPYRLAPEARVVAGEALHIAPELYTGDYNRNALIDDITWASDNPDVATVGYGGGIGSIYGMSKGEATVTLTGSLGAKCAMRVEVCDPPTQIWFEESDPLTLGAPEDDSPGEARQLTVCFKPGEYWSDVTYSSSDPGVVSVTEDGLVRALTPNKTATITATADKVSASIVVEVKRAPTGLYFVDGKGRRITKPINVIKGLRVAIPAVRPENEGAAGMDSLVYTVDGRAAGGSFLARDDCTIRVTAYNGVSAELDVKVSENDALGKMQAWYKGMYDPANGAQAKLVRAVNAVNRAAKRELQAIAQDFDAAKRDWATDSDFNDGVDGFNMAVPDFTGTLESAMKLLFYTEFTKPDSAIADLSDCEDEKSLLKAINRMIKGDSYTKTVTLGDATYTFKLDEIGTSEIGARFITGKVTVKPASGASTTLDVGATIVDFEHVRGFMDALEELARAQMTDALQQFITGGLDPMGVEDENVLDRMAAFYMESEPVKALLVGLLNRELKNNAGTVLAKLVMDKTPFPQNVLSEGDGCYEQSLTLKERWENLMEFMEDEGELIENAVMYALGKANVFSLEDIEELKNVLSETDVVNQIGALTYKVDPEKLGKKIDELWAAL